MNPPTILEVFAQHPELLAITTILMRLGLIYQRGLTWYEYRTLHGLRRILFPLLDKRLSVVSFVNEKENRAHDPEYLRTVEGTIKSVTCELREGGGSLHLLSSLKRRPSGLGDRLSGSHVVWTHSDGTQTEAYLFNNHGRTVDVYVHHEASVSDPVGHLSGGGQVDGDVRGVVTEALDG